MTVNHPALHIHVDGMNSCGSVASGQSLASSPRGHPGCSRAKESSSQQCGHPCPSDSPHDSFSMAICRPYFTVHWVRCPGLNRKSDSSCFPNLKGKELHVLNWGYPNAEYPWKNPSPFRKIPHLSEILKAVILAFRTPWLRPSHLTLSWARALSPFYR